MTRLPRTSTRFPGESRDGPIILEGALSFGLVEIGVMLQPARSAHDLSFSLLDRRDFSPVGFRRYNKRTGEEVPWDRVVKLGIDPLRNLRGATRAAPTRGASGRAPEPGSPRR